MEPVFIKGSRIPALVSIFFKVAAITIGPWVFCRDTSPSTALMNHESIHVKQWVELGFVLFPVLYLMAWLFGLVVHRSPVLAYLAIPFEREAREFEGEPHKRRAFGWRKYDLMELP